MYVYIYVCVIICVSVYVCVACIILNVIYFIKFMMYIQCYPRINIKGGGVHQWYMTFDQQCFSVSKLNDGGGGGSAMVSPFGGNTVI